MVSIVEKRNPRSQPCEVLATIRLPKDRRINIDRTPDSLPDVFLNAGVVEDE